MGIPGGPGSPLDLGAATADADLNHEIDALRAAVDLPGPERVRAEERLRLGELLMGRALGVRPAPDVLFDLRTVMEIAARLTEAEGRRDLDAAASQLTCAAATSDPEQAVRAAHWLSVIRRFRPYRPEPELRPEAAGRPPGDGADASTGHRSGPGEDPLRPSGTAEASVPGGVHGPGGGVWVVIERARRRRLARRDPDLGELRRAYRGLPPDEPARAAVLAEIGLAYALLTERDSEAAGVAAATLTEALGLLPGAHPLRGEVLLALATALFALHATEPPRQVLHEVVAVVRPDAEPVHPRLAEVVRCLAVVLRGTDAGDTAGLEDLRRAASAVGAGHPLYGMVMAVLGGRLARHAELDGGVAAMEAAERCLVAAERSLGDDWAHAGLPASAFRVPRAEGLVMRARAGWDPGPADQAIRILDSELARLPAADPWSPRALRALGEAWRVRGELLDRGGEVRRGCELIIAAHAAAPAAHPDAARLAGAAALARAELADGPGGWDEVIHALVEVVDQAGLTSGERAELLLRLAAALRDRGGPGDDEHRTARLEQAKVLLEEIPDHPLVPTLRSALRASGHPAGDH